MVQGETNQQLMTDQEAGRALERLAHEIQGSTLNGDDLVVVGIRRRGVELAERIAATIEDIQGGPVATGSLDIGLYRDDFGQIGPRPVIGTTDVPGDITGKRVVIVDDVLFTGRTIRAALNELSDFGRPRKIELCVLVDRGERELPIQADYVGMEIAVPDGFQISVAVPELDGELHVALVRAPSQDEESYRPPDRELVTDD